MRVLFCYGNVRFNSGIFMWIVVPFAHGVETFGRGVRLASFYAEVFGIIRVWAEVDEAIY